MRRDHSLIRRRRVSRRTSFAPLWCKDDCTKLLTDAGYSVVAFDDLTESWTDFVSKRQAAYVERKERTIKVHGQDTFDTQMYFFDAIKKLFTGGNLGGCRIVATKNN